MEDRAAQNSCAPAFHTGDAAFHVWRLGAFPLLTITIDRLMERESIEIPSRYNGRTDASSIPPERLAAWNAAVEPINRRSRERGIRFLEIGNAISPTDWRNTPECR